MRLCDARGRRDYVPPTGVGLIEAESTCREKLLLQWQRLHRTALFRRKQEVTQHCYSVFLLKRSKPELQIFRFQLPQP